MALCYTDELRWRAHLSRIPSVLRERFCDGFEELAINLGLRAIAANDHSVEIDLSGASAGNFFRWLDEAYIAAVSIGPADIVPLLGRTLDSLLLKRAIEQGSLRFEKLLPDEIMSTLRDAAWTLSQTSTNEDEVSGTYLDAAKFELVKSGLMKQHEVDSYDHDPLANFGEKVSGKYDGGDRGRLPVELTESQPDQFDPFM